MNTKEIFSKRKNLVIISSRKQALLILVLVTAGFIGWRILNNQQQQPQYQTAKVEKGTIVSSVNASGYVQSTNIMNVASTATGIVKKVYVKDGEKVVAGQKIAEITLDVSGQQKNAERWASYLSAKNSLDSANAAAYTLRSSKDTAWKKFYDLAINSTYQNTDGTLREDQRNSSSEFQSLQADWLASEAKYKNQQAVIEQSKASLNSAWLSYQSTSPVITAPISGTVSNVGFVEGMVVEGQTGNATSDQMANQRAAVIQNEANPILSFNVTEIDVPKLKISQKATVTLDSLTGKTFTGKVVTIDKIGTTSNNVTSYPAMIQLDTTSSEILPNMAANAAIIVETKSDVMLVPSSAIQIQGEESFVRVLQGNREQQVSVEAGISSDTQTEIISGLSEGEEIIIGTSSTATGQRNSGSVFGGGAFRPGGFSGGSRGGVMQH